MIRPIRIRKPEPKNDWLSKACQHIAENEEIMEESSRYVCERLAALLINRLPEEISRSLIGLLPDPPAWMFTQIQKEGDPSISYSDFIECAMDAIALEIPDRATDEHSLEQAGRRVADLFLASLAYEVPGNIVGELSHRLPDDLSFRISPNEPAYRRAS